MRIAAMPPPPPPVLVRMAAARRPPVDVGERIKKEERDKNEKGVDEDARICVVLWLVGSIMCVSRCGWSGMKPFVSVSPGGDGRFIIGQSKVTIQRLSRELRTTTIWIKKWHLSN